RSASCDPVVLLRPKTGRPSPHESASPAFVSTAHSRPRHTAILLASGADCRLAVPPLRRLGRTRSNPASRSADECRSTSAPPAVHLAHDAATTPPAQVRTGSSSAYLFLPSSPLCISSP